jgi:hypothetical protein
MSIFAGVAASGAGQIDAMERNTEDWILSPKAKKKLAKQQGAKQ